MIEDRRDGSKYSRPVRSGGKALALALAGVATAFGSFGLGFMPGIYLGFAVAACGIMIGFLIAVQIWRRYLKE